MKKVKSIVCLVVVFVVVFLASCNAFRLTAESLDVSLDGRTQMIDLGL